MGSSFSSISRNALHSPSLSNLNPSVYRTRERFMMPQFSGKDKLVISFTNTESTIVSAAYALIFSLISISLWELICIAAMMRTPSKSGRAGLQNTTLVKMWNTPNPLTCLTYLFEAAKADPALPNFITLFLLVAIAVCGLAASLLGPSRLVVSGNLAPVSGHPQDIFFPNIDKINFGDKVMVNNFFAALSSPVLRAIGNAESMLPELGKSDLVSFSYEQLPQPEQDEGQDVPVFRMTYSYQVTGADFGLQHASKLLHTVKGECNTTYKFLEPRDEGNDIHDTYSLFNGIYKQVFNVSKVEPAVSQVKPTTYWFYGPTEFTPNNSSAIYYFAAIPTTAHRYSLDVQPSDPWFLTENFTHFSELQNANTTQRIKDRRPALYCQQQDTWSYFDQHKAMGYLGELLGLPLPLVLQNILGASLSGGAMPQIGFINGDTALAATNTYNKGALAARAGNITENLWLLVAASYAFTRDTFRGTALTFDTFGFPNIFDDGNGNPVPGASEILISTTDVVTYSVLWMLVVPAFLIFLLLARLVLWLLRRNPDSAFLLDWRRRCKAYDAGRMYESIKLLSLRIQKGEFEFDPNSQFGENRIITAQELENYVPKIFVAHQGHDRRVFLMEKSDYIQDPGMNGNDYEDVSVPMNPVAKS